MTPFFHCWGLCFIDFKRMHLMYYVGDDGKRVYTLKVKDDYSPLFSTAASIR
jgi:hypothetical protein